MMQDQPDHSPWYQPRGPEIIMRGGEGFANRIGSGLDKLADGLGKFLEKRREEGKLEVANGKAALATLKASPSLQKSLNITPEDAERMSPAERSAAVFGGLAGMKQEEGFRAGQAQTAKILADALTQRQEAEGNTAFDLAQAAASRPGTLEIPNTTLPGIFPDRTVRTRSQPTLQEAAQQILQTPGAARSRAGIQLLEAAAREREQQMGENDPLAQYKSETERMRAEAYRKQVEGMRGGGADAPAGVPEQPTDEPPEGFVWTFDGRNWRQTQKRGLTTGDALDRQLNGGKSTDQASEVKRFTADGRAAIFDSKSKKFLRYAD